MSYIEYNDAATRQVIRVQHYHGSVYDFTATAITHEGLVRVYFHKDEGWSDVDGRAVSFQLGEEGRLFLLGVLSTSLEGVRQDLKEIKRGMKYYAKWAGMSTED